MEKSTTFEQELGSLLPRLRRFAHTLSRSRADADDLTQMTAERALARRSQWLEGTRLEPWLYRIMHNLWIDTARQRTRQLRVEAPSEEGIHIGEDPRDKMHNQIDLDRAMTLLALLPDEQREVVALVLIEGLGYQEAADMLGIPMGTVASRLTRGRTALLSLLQPKQHSCHSTRCVASVGTFNRRVRVSVFAGSSTAQHLATDRQQKAEH